MDSEAVSVADANASCVDRASLPTKLPYVAATQIKIGTVPTINNVNFQDMANMTTRAPTMVAENLSPMEMLVVTAFFKTSVSDANRLTSSPDLVVSKIEQSFTQSCDHSFARQIVQPTSQHGKQTTNEE